MCGPRTLYPTMPRKLALAPLGAAIFAAAACSGGDTEERPTPNLGTSPAVIALSNCAALGVSEVARAGALVFELFADVPDGNPTRHVSIDTTTGTFQVMADLDQDGSEETTILGQLLDFSDLADGFQLGEQLSFSFSVFGGPTTGRGVLTVTNQGLSARLTGEAEISLEGTGCSMHAPAIDVAVGVTRDGNVAGNGTIGFSSHTEAGEMTGTVTYIPNADPGIVASALGESVFFLVDVATGTAFIE